MTDDPLVDGTETERWQRVSAVPYVVPPEEHDLCENEQWAHVMERVAENYARERDVITAAFMGATLTPSAEQERRFTREAEQQVLLARMAASDASPRFEFNSGMSLINQWGQIRDAMRVARERYGSPDQLYIPPGAREESQGTTNETADTQALREMMRAMHEARMAQTAATAVAFAATSTPTWSTMANIQATRQLQSGSVVSVRRLKKQLESVANEESESNG